MREIIRTAFAKQENVALGLGLAVFVFAMFSGLDAITKHLTASFPQTQITWFRFSTQTLMALPFLFMYRRARPWKPVHLGDQIIRGIAIAGTTICNTIAVTHLPLSVTGTLFFTSPFWVAVLSIPLLGERIGWRRWTAISVGFVGVLIALRPFGEGVLHWSLLVALCSPLFFAVLSIYNRKTAKSEHFVTMFFFMTLVGTIAFFPLMVYEFVMPTLQSFVLLLLPGFLGGLAHALFIVAARYCPAPILAPMIYLELCFFVTYDVLFFDYVPDIYILLGAAVIAGCGLVIFSRERQAKEKKLRAH